MGVFDPLENTSPGPASAVNVAVNWLVDSLCIDTILSTASNQLGIVLCSNENRAAGEKSHDHDRQVFDRHPTPSSSHLLVEAVGASLFHHRLDRADGVCVNHRRLSNNVSNRPQKKQRVQRAIHDNRTARISARNSRTNHSFPTERQGDPEEEPNI